MMKLPVPSFKLGTNFCLLGALNLKIFLEVAYFITKNLKKCIFFQKLNIKQMQFFDYYSMEGRLSIKTALVNKIELKVKINQIKAFCVYIDSRLQTFTAINLGALCSLPFLFANKKKNPVTLLFYQIEP